MDWRSWAYQNLIEAGNPILDILPAGSVYGAGSLKGSPAKKPFLVLRFGPKVRRRQEGPYSRTLEVWIHDEPGDYMQIESLIPLVRAQLEGQVALPGAVSCEWSGDSSDLADDGFNTITRNTLFVLVGSD